MLVGVFMPAYSWWHTVQAEGVLDEGMVSISQASCGQGPVSALNDVLLDIIACSETQAQGGGSKISLFYILERASVI